jgi:hypothetical protein
MSALNLTNVDFQTYKNQFAPAYTLKLLIQFTLRPVGILTCLLNILIFSRKALLDKAPAFHILLAMSYIDLLYLAPLLYLNLINTFCEISSTQCGEEAEYWTLITYWVINDLVSSALALSNIIIELFLTVQRLFMIVNKPYMKNWSPMKVVLGVLIGTHVFYLPIWLRNTVAGQTVYLANSTTITEYKYVKSAYGSSPIGLILPTIWSVVRLILCGPILLACNLISVYYFRIFLSKKKAVSTTTTAAAVVTQTTTASSTRATSEGNSLTLMLIMTSFLYTFGNLPFMISYSVSNIAPTLSNTFTVFISWFSLLCLIMLIVLKPVIFVAFNKLYRELFLHYVLCKSLKAGMLDNANNSVNNSLARTAGTTKTRSNTAVKSQV